MLLVSAPPLESMSEVMLRASDVEVSQARSVETLRSAVLDDPGLDDGPSVQLEPEHRRPMALDALVELWRASATFLAVPCPPEGACGPTGNPPCPQGHCGEDLSIDARSRSRHMEGGPK